MSTNLIEEIAAKAAALPVEQQHELLAYIESLSEAASGQSVTPFQSVKGILHNDLDNLEHELSEVRREMWHNFPREEPH